MRHFELYQSVKVNSQQHLGSQKGFEEPQKLKISIFTLATENDTNFIEIKCCYFFFSEKEVIVTPILK